MLFPRPASEPLTVGPYLLTELIGQGGMAVVYKAKRQGTGGFGNAVAGKAMPPGLVGRKEMVGHFRPAAQPPAAPTPPNLPQVHDLGVHDGVPYLLKGFFNGRNLTPHRMALAKDGIAG